MFQISELSDNESNLTQDNDYDSVNDVNPSSSPDENEAERVIHVDFVEDGNSESNDIITMGVDTSQIFSDVCDSVTPSAPEEETFETNTENEEVPEPSNPDEIHVRLKYLDDTERHVVSHPSVTIGDFKRYANKN